MRKLLNENEKVRRIMQYLMVIGLLLAVFVLPGCGEVHNVKEKNSKEQNVKVQNSETKNSEMQVSETQASEISVIVLDPGHGGNDCGMVGASGVAEKALNLVYAQKLAVLLEQKGFRVVLTRNTDAWVYEEHPGTRGEKGDDTGSRKSRDMRKRCEIIAKEAPVLTVSIHQNSYPQDNSVRGPQVFYYGQSLEGERLASCIQEELNTQLQIARPRIQKADEKYYILKHAAGTTVLVEMGFLTNPEEERLLQQESYQDRAVQAVCDGILRYLGE